MSQVEEAKLAAAPAEQEPPKPALQWWVVYRDDEKADWKVKSVEGDVLDDSEIHKLGAEKPGRELFLVSTIRAYRAETVIRQLMR